MFTHHRCRMRLVQVTMATHLTRDIIYRAACSQTDTHVLQNLVNFVHCLELWRKVVVAAAREFSDVRPQRHLGFKLHARGFLVASALEVLNHHEEVQHKQSQHLPHLAPKLGRRFSLLLRELVVVRPFEAGDGQPA